MLKCLVGLCVLFSVAVQAETSPTDNVLQIYSSFGDIRAGNNNYHFKDIIITNISDKLSITNIAFAGAECKGKFETSSVLQGGEVAVYRIYNSCEYTGFTVFTDKGNFNFGKVN